MCIYLCVYTIIYITCLLLLFKLILCHVYPKVRTISSHIYLFSIVVYYVLFKVLIIRSLLLVLNHTTPINNKAIIYIPSCFPTILLCLLQCLLNITTSHYLHSYFKACYPPKEPGAKFNVCKNHESKTTTFLVQR